jgi:hypothetical protein
VKYAIERCTFDPYARVQSCFTTPPSWTQVADVTETAAVDYNTTPDTPYLYRVLPHEGTAAPDAYPIPEDHNIADVGATPAPGEHTALKLTDLVTGEDRTPWGDRWLPGAQNSTLRVPAVPDGAYNLSITLTDWNHGSTPVTAITPILLDGTPPATRVLLGPYVGGNLAHNGGISIPFAAGDDGVGVATTYVYARLDDGTWHALVADPATGTAFFPEVNDGSTLDVIAFSQDKVGNMEGVVPRPWTVSPDDAFSDLLAAGAITSSKIDITPPFGPRQDAELYVQPGTPVNFTVPITETGSGIASVVLLAGSDRVPMTTTDGQTYHATWIGKTPGRYQALVVATDNAGNVGTVRMGNVAVDNTPPTIQQVQLDYGNGRIAGQPGDLVTLRIDGTDDLTPTGRLHVSINASTVSSRSAIDLTYDIAGKDYVGTMLLDRVRSDSIVVSVTDLAGNVAKLTVPVLVDGNVASIANITADAQADRIQIKWTTDAPTYGRVLYGTTPRLDQATSFDDLKTAHAAVLTNLTPGTDYYVKVDATTRSGVESFSNILTERTSQGLIIDVLPSEGMPVSRGTTDLRIHVQDHQGADVTNASLQVFITTPLGSSQVVANAVLAGAEGDVPLPLNGFRDGAYVVNVTAASNGLTGNVTAGILVLDRTAPLVHLDIPPVIHAGDELLANVSERGSGIDLANASWTFALPSGRSFPCAPTLTGDVLACVVPDVGGDTPIFLHVRLPDAAGNVGQLDGATRVSPSQIAIDHVHVATSDGFPRLRSSVGAILSLDVSDPTVSIVADLTSLGGRQAQPVALESDGHGTLSFQVGPVPDGEHDITIHVTRKGQDVNDQTVPVVVDSTPPRASGIALLSSTTSTATIQVVTNEATQAALDIPGATVDLAKDPALTHLVHVQGLRPSASQTVEVKLTDLAGNVALAPLEIKTLPDTTPPGAIHGLVAEDEGDGRLRLAWDASSDDTGIDGYHVERTIANAPTKTFDVNGSTELVDIVPPGVLVAYRVTAVDEGGNPGAPATVQITSIPVPHLSDGVVDPPTGGPGDYTYRVRVVDAAGQPPTVFVVVDGTRYAMRTTADSCAKGCDFVETVKLGPTRLSIPHSYSFVAESLQSRVIYPLPDSLPGPIVIAGAPPPQGALRAASPVTSIGVPLLLACAAVAAFAYWRRRP